MKKQKEILGGIVILIVGFIIGIVAAVIVVESDIPSSASNDGWLGFFGGLFGSLISGIITFFVLYINRKDAQATIEENKKETERIQLENYHQTMMSLEQQSNILKYQTHMKISSDVMELAAELIKIAEDYYVNVADNTYGYYREKRQRSLEICRIIIMKLYGIDEAGDLIQQVKFYQNSFCKRKPPYKEQQEKLNEITQWSENLRHTTEDFCFNFIDIDCFY